MAVNMVVGPLVPPSSRLRRRLNAFAGARPRRSRHAGARVIQPLPLLKAKLYLAPAGLSPGRWVVHGRRSGVDATRARHSSRW